ncbi:hypothetical protein [Belnapia rosea]|uniref:hypothetical protein n=1 Tax=Belnapia rosea TaxID=938405 RepID=UPI00159FBDEE|nr:hypothetical protein [Belnapia rosea]
MATLMDAYDRAAEALFCIRSGATAAAHGAALVGASEVIGAYLEDRARGAGLAMPQARRAHRAGVACLAGLAAEWGRGPPAPLRVRAFRQATGACLSHWGDFIQCAVAEDSCAQVWLAPAFSFMTAVAAGSRRHAQDAVSECDPAPGAPSAAVYAEELRRAVLSGLREVKYHSEKTLRGTWASEVAVSESNAFARTFVDGVMGAFGDASMHGEHGRIRVVRRKAEYVKKLSLELETRLHG